VTLRSSQTRSYLNTDDSYYTTYVLWREVLGIVINFSQIRYHKLEGDGLTAQKARIRWSRSKRRRSATARLLGTPILSGECAQLCHLQTSTMRQPRPELGCSATKKNAHKIDKHLQCTVHGTATYSVMIPDSV